MAVNSAFAAMLGYASRSETTEFARIGGLFADDTERHRVMTLLGSASATGIEHVRLKGPGGTVVTLHLRARVADIANTQDYIVIVEPANT